MKHRTTMRSAAAVLTAAFLAASPAHAEDAKTAAIKAAAWNPGDCSADASAKLAEAVQANRKEAQLARAIQLLAGLCGRKGDDRVSLQLLQRAAEQGYQPAMYVAAVVLQRHLRAGEAIPLLVRAAERGQPRAALNLLLLHADRLSPHSDPVKAVVWGRFAMKLDVDSQASTELPTLVQDLEKRLTAAQRERVRSEELALKERTAAVRPYSDVYDKYLPDVTALTLQIE